MKIPGPCVKIPPRRIKAFFTPDPSKPASLRPEVYSFSLFENPPSRGFFLIFSQGPKESYGKVLHEPLKMTVSGPCLKISSRKFRFIFTPDPAKLTSLRPEIYTMDLFGNPPSRGLILISSLTLKESYGKVLHEPLNMTFLVSCLKIPLRRFKFIFSPDSAKSPSLRPGPGCSKAD